MNHEEGRTRTVISSIQPIVEEGRFAIKRIVGDTITISADIFCDGHQFVAADLLFRFSAQKNWEQVPMIIEANDRWFARFQVNQLGVYYFKIVAWVDYFKSWQKDTIKKLNSGISIQDELEIGIRFLEQSVSKKKYPQVQQFLIAIKKARNEEQKAALALNEELSWIMRGLHPNKEWVTDTTRSYSVIVDPPKARFSTWYEIFPRSWSPDPYSHGTFKDCLELLPRISKMGFDVLYFPPIHPIGYTKRKGKRNQLKANPDDLGSPWAIGSQEGGHTSLHPKLGSMKDFRNLLEKAKDFGIDIALDIAFQCSLDHPYLKEHPDWFLWKQNGTIQCAENPPKKYEDIVPFYFETEDWKNLWKELREILMFWIKQGIRIFRIDNPHTKSFLFWEWLITSIKEKHPEVIFLSEAFTRPKVMYWLSKLGFTQSYTYFTWRHTKQEITDYISEIVLTPVKEYFRPNLWTNTPDILTEELQQGVPSTFIKRLILAATLSSNYGMYAPAFEWMDQEALPGTEEYLNSEKYQLLDRNRPPQESLESIITHMNNLRKKNPALQHTSNLQFFDIDNDQMIYYGKFQSEQALLILVNLDSFNVQSGTIRLPLDQLGLSPKGSYKVHELLLDHCFIWEGETQTVTIDVKMPACIFSFQKKVRREGDFEYF